ncbi:MAG: hypothetical protein RMM31_01455 [Anaerolineae bacterium]|nr:hypothetical protein [Anaerolineae bacterium]
MDIPLGTLLLGLAVLVLTAMIVALPLFDRKAPAVRPPTPREALEMEHETIVRNLRELDFDYRTRKINEEDYRQLRAALIQRGAEVLRGLRSARERDVDEEIESAVAAARQRNEDAKR